VRSILAFCRPGEEGGGAWTAENRGEKICLSYGLRGTGGYFLYHQREEDGPALTEESIGFYFRRKKGWPSHALFPNRQKKGHAANLHSGPPGREARRRSPSLSSERKKSGRKDVSRDRGLSGGGEGGRGAPGTEEERRTRALKSWRDALEVHLSF